MPHHIFKAFYSPKNCRKFSLKTFTGQNAGSASRHHAHNRACHCSEKRSVHVQRAITPNEWNLAWLYESLLESGFTS
jgi:hypothetical protein